MGSFGLKPQIEIIIEVVKIIIINPNASLKRDLKNSLKPLGKIVELFVELKSFILTL